MCVCAGDSSLKRLLLRIHLKDFIGNFSGNDVWSFFSSLCFCGLIKSNLNFLLNKVVRQLKETTICYWRLHNIVHLCKFKGNVIWPVHPEATYVHYTKLVRFIHWIRFWLCARFFFLLLQMPSTIWIGKSCIAAAHQINEKFLNLLSN